MSEEAALRSYQRAKKRETVGKVEAGISAIEAEVKEHNYYPYNRGRITLKEVCRRAGIGESTLKNRTHRATLARVNAWLQRLKRAAPTTFPQAEDAKQARLKDLVKKLDALARHFNLFKIEYDAQSKRIAELEGESQALKLRLTELQADGINVVALRADRPKSDRGSRR